AGAAARGRRLRQPDRDGALTRAVAPAHLRRARSRRGGRPAAGGARRGGAGDHGGCPDGPGSGGVGRVAKGAGGPPARRLGRLRPGAEAAGRGAAPAEGTPLITRPPPGIGYAGKAGARAAIRSRERFSQPLLVGLLAPWWGSLVPYV